MNATTETTTDMSRIKGTTAAMARTKGANEEGPPWLTDEDDSSLDERARIEARDRVISEDIDRIKRDIAAVAARYGFHELTFSIAWPDTVDFDQPPTVNCDCSLF